MTQKTLLDEFAMTALTGLISYEQLCHVSLENEERLYAQWVKKSYEVAQLMMQERQKYEEIKQSMSMKEARTEIKNNWKGRQL
jgi:hypothetical protein